MSSALTLNGALPIWVSDQISAGLEKGTLRHFFSWEVLTGEAGPTQLRVGLRVEEALQHSWPCEVLLHLLGACQLVAYRRTPAPQFCSVLRTHMSRRAVSEVVSTLIAASARTSLSRALLLRCTVCSSENLQ
jgi:hypothetical protein